MNDKQEEPEAYGSSDEANFIKNMQILREQRGWSQGEFARQMQAQGWTSFHQTTVSRIEKGERPVRLGEARGIAKVLGTITSQMILPDDEFINIRELELALIGLEAIHKNFQGFVADLDVQRSIIDFHLREVLAEKPNDDMDPPVVERREFVIDQARRLLDTSYNDLIHSYMKSTNPHASIPDEDDS